MDDVSTKAATFPQIYAEFEGKSKNGAAPRKYWIQDATENFFEDMVGHLQNDFSRDEPISKYMKGCTDEISCAEVADYTRELLKKRISLVCLTKDEFGEQKLAGLNVLSLETEAESEEDYTSEGWFLPFMINIFDYIDQQRSVYKELGVDKIVKAIGLYVVPEYRGEGIAEQILRARKPLCRRVGAKVTSTIFTSLLSQKAAYKAGYKDFYSIDYEELAKINPKFSIPGIQEHTKTIKVLYKLVD